MEWANYVYPVLSICGLFGVILALGIGFFYLWLLYLGKKASKCPECDRKGAGELLESEVIHSKVYTEWRDASGFRKGSGERQQIQVTEKMYEDHFKCEHCGHEWTTTAQEIERAPR